MTDKEVLCSRILAHEGCFTSVYARNCEVRRISRDEAGRFLEAFHSLGDTGSRYRYGLFISRKDHSSLPLGTMVAVATFSSARRWIKTGADGGTVTIRSYEWIRYASLPDVRIAGGMGKVLQAFIDETKPDDIMTYSMEEDWKAGLSGAVPSGDVYIKLGFKEESAQGGRRKFRLKLTEYID